MKIYKRTKPALEMNIENTKAMEELQVISLDLEIQIYVVQIMSVFCIVVVVSLVVVNYLSVVTSCCVIFSSSNTLTYQCEKNINKSTTIDILLELYIVISHLV
jgi:hypothetical protein